MARANKRTSDLAEVLGVPPSTLQGQINEGYGPALDLGSAGLLDHFRRLQPLLGKGRDGGVAVLKHAADYGCPCLRLRDVLRATADEYGQPMAGADELVDAITADSGPLWAVTLSATTEVGEPVEHVAHNEARVAYGLDAEPFDELLMGRSAFLPVAQVVAGEALDEGDTEDLDRITDAIVRRLVGGAIPAGIGLDQRDVLRFAADIVCASEPWLDEATPHELADGVQAALCLYDALAVVDPAAFNRPDEERWRWIALAAPVSPHLLAILRAILTASLPALAELGVTFNERERAFLAALCTPLPGPSLLAAEYGKA